jgi:hypothetical protein
VAAAAAAAAVDGVNIPDWTGYESPPVRFACSPSQGRLFRGVAGGGRDVDDDADIDLNFADVPTAKTRGCGQ